MGEPVTTGDVAVIATTADQIESFHHALDAVARERKHLTMLEAFPLAQTRAFVLAMIERGDPHVVATAGDRVVGWCDISRHVFPSHAHRGNLGMGIVPAYRGQGLGGRLISAALIKPGKRDLFASSCRFTPTTSPQSLSTRRLVSCRKASTSAPYALTIVSSTRSAWPSCSTGNDRSPPRPEPGRGSRPQIIRTNIFSSVSEMRTSLPESPGRHGLAYIGRVTAFSLS